MDEHGIRAEQCDKLLITRFDRRNQPTVSNRRQVIVGIRWEFTHDRLGNETPHPQWFMQMCGQLERDAESRSL